MCVLYDRGIEQSTEEVRNWIKILILEITFPFTVCRTLIRSLDGQSLILSLWCRILPRWQRKRSWSISSEYVSGTKEYSRIVKLIYSVWSNTAGWTGLVAYMIWQTGSYARLPRTPRTPRSAAAHYLFVLSPLLLRLFVYRADTMLLSQRWDSSYSWRIWMGRIRYSYWLGWTFCFRIISQWFVISFQNACTYICPLCLYAVICVGLAIFADGIIDQIDNTRSVQGNYLFFLRFPAEIVWNQYCEFLLRLLCHITVTNVCVDGRQRERRMWLDSIQLPAFLYQIPRNSIVAVGLPIALGFSTGFITRNSVKTWYKPLIKPAVSHSTAARLNAERIPNWNEIMVCNRVNHQRSCSPSCGLCSTLRWYDIVSLLKGSSDDVLVKLTKSNKDRV